MSVTGRAKTISTLPTVVAVLVVSIPVPSVETAVFFLFFFVVVIGGVSSSFGLCYRLIKKAMQEDTDLAREHAPL